MTSNSRPKVAYLSASQKSSLLFTLMAMLLITAVGASAQGIKGSTFCQKIQNNQLMASSGALMACFGPQPNGAAPSATRLSSLIRSMSPGGSGNSAGGSGNGNTFTTTNIDAGNPSEDQENGTQAYGQSEVSIAANGPYVVEGWNDATGFFAAPCSPGYKDQLTGFGFSANGGKTFTDEGGLPNIYCAISAWSGDPSIETQAVSGTTYFYVSSLLSALSPLPGGSVGLLVALTACQVVAGPVPSISCNQVPTVIATNPGNFNFEDKDFMAIDTQRGLLYVSFTDFNSAPTFDNIDVTVCDIGNGFLGGGPGNPVCGTAYIIASASDCAELEGAYPAVDPNTGDVYVTWEYNWATNLFGCHDQVQNQVAHLPFIAAGVFGTPNYNVVNITSMDGAFVPGYNRFPGSDFPRIAVSHTAGTVSIVWNDAGRNPLGDILLQSFKLGSLTPVQASPVRLNTDTGIGTLHFLPALRYPDAHGNLNVSWFDRRTNPNTAITNVFAALGVSPTTTTVPKSNVQVTNVSSNWLAASSDIVPNFGDYTDNYFQLTSGSGLTGELYVAWSDGRISDPQPYNAHQGLK